jgi:hypothetical protein
MSGKGELADVIKWEMVRKAEILAIGKIAIQNTSPVSQLSCKMWPSRRGQRLKSLNHVSHLNPAALPGSEARMLLAGSCTSRLRSISALSSGIKSSRSWCSCNYHVLLYIYFQNLLLRIRRIHEILGLPDP